MVCVMFEGIQMIVVLVVRGEEGGCLDFIVWSSKVFDATG